MNIDALNTVTPNLADLMADLVNWQIYPIQLSIDALNTVTPNLADLMDLRYPPSQLSIDALHTATPNLALYWQIYPLQLSIDALNTVTQTWHRWYPLADLPPSIEHRCLEYC